MNVTDWVLVPGPGFFLAPQNLAVNSPIAMKICRHGCDALRNHDRNFLKLVTKSPPAQHCGKNHSPTTTANDPSFPATSPAAP